MLSLYIVVTDAVCLIRYKKMIVHELGFFWISLRSVMTFPPTQALSLAALSHCTAATQVVT